MDHLVSHINHPKVVSNDIMHVIGVISNPVRYHSRYRLFRNWLKEMVNSPNVQVHVVEAVFGDRHSECDPVTCGMEYSYHQVRITSEIWIKENLINIGVRNLLPSDWKYLAWVDCDVHFRSNDWATSTIHQLQHYNVVQPWSDAVDLDFYGGILAHYKSFGSFRAKNQEAVHHGQDPYKPYAHSGFAWACTRYFYENIEKLADFNPVGAGDHLMAWAMLDKVGKTMPTTASADYLNRCQIWANKASKACAKMVGFTPGRIEHNFHGPKTRRNYWGRWDILINNNFRPSFDLSYDSQGVVQLCGANKYKIEEQVMLYNRARHEDSIETT